MTRTNQFMRIFAFTILMLLLLNRQAGAQSPGLPPNAAKASGLTGVITNHSVIISWPRLPGNWQLLEQKPAFTADWKPVPPKYYRTNSVGVSATLPIPAKPALYRLKFAFHPTVAPPMPPMPPLQTNRPTPVKLPGNP